MTAKQAFLAAIPVALAVFLATRAIDSDVYEGGEAREALVAREMVDTGDWILPLWNGAVVPSKPPLYHWLVAAGATATGAGVTERTLRAPCAILSGVLVLVVLLAGRAWLGFEAGWLAALVLATTPQFLTEASDGRVDMTLCTAITAAQVAVVQALRGRRGARVALAVCLALAMLAKGPVGPGLVGLTVLVWSVGERDLRPALRLVRPVPVLVFVAIAGGWYGAAYLHRGWDFVAKQIVSENGEALLGGERFPYRSALFYVVPFVLGGLPWTLLLPWVVRRAWRGTLAERYCLAWVATVFVFFSLAPLKRAAYLLPLRPALALVIGAWLAATAAEEGVARGPAALLRALAAAAVASGAAVVATALAVAHGVWTLDRVRAAATRAEIDVDVYRAAIVAHEAALVAAGVAALVGGVLVLRALGRDRWRDAAIATAATTAAAAVVVLGVFVPARAAQKSIRPFARAITAHVPAGAPLALLTPDEEIPLIYYVGRHLPLAQGRPETLAAGYYVVDRTRWDAWPSHDGWREVARSPHVFSRHRRDLVLVRRD